MQQLSIVETEANLLEDGLCDLEGTLLLTHLRAEQVIYDHLYVRDVLIRVLWVLANYCHHKDGESRNEVRHLFGPV